MDITCHAIIVICDTYVYDNYYVTSDCNHLIIHSSVRVNGSEYIFSFFLFRVSYM